MTHQEKIKAFAELVEREQAERFKEEYPRLDPPKVHIRPGKKYTKVDVGGSGKYMVDADGNIFGIKAYGVIHKQKRYGTLDTINKYLWGWYAPVMRRAES